MSNVKISTKTIIGVSNIECDIDKIYQDLEVREMDEADREKIMCLIPFKKQRGRRKKETEQNLEEKKNLSTLLVQPVRGDIVGLYYQDHQKGLPQYLKYNKKYFRNALNIIMMLSDTKKVNFKLSKNGKIQMTGCKEDEDAKDCLMLFFEKLFHQCRDAIRLMNNDTSLIIHYYTVMTNIDFNMGFKINRQKLNVMVNKTTEFNSLLETSFGYTGVNIKMPMYLDENLLIDKLIMNDDKWKAYRVTFYSFLDQMNETFRIQELNKKRYNTFLVFHSGNVIMSGMRIDKMMDLQESFFKLLQTHRNDIEELLT
jgi:TATA-box binding protein (TBP) (component of TFIID and TFIIIB)